MTLRTLLDRFDLLMDTPESVSKLRRFISTMAVRGKLTKQNPGDTSANVLLQQVRTKKQKLYDRGDIRKPKSFESVEEDQKPFNIPSNWVWTRVGEIRRGWGRKEPDEPFPYLDVSSINKEDGEISEEYEVIPPEEAPSRARKKVRPGTVLYSSVRPYLLNIAIVDDRFDREPIASTAFIIVHPLGDIDEKYVYYYLRSAPMVDYVEDQMAGMAYPAISKTKFLPAPFPLPPPEEQQRIVKTVDRLMDECDALEQQQKRESNLQVQGSTAATEALQSADNAEALRPAWERVREHFDTVTATPEGVAALRQTILQLAVQGRLTERDPDDTPADVLLERIQREKQRLYDAGEIRKPKNGSDIEDQELPFDLPQSWKWARLTDAVQRVVDCLHETAPFEDEATGYYCVDTTCMNETEIEFENLRPVSEETYEEWTRRMVPQEGDILFSREGNIGLTAIVPEDMKLCLGQRMMIFRLPDELMSRYFHLVLQSPAITKQWKPEVMGTAATRVNISTIRDFLVPIPPVEEQARITRTVNEILPTCDDLKTKTVEAMERGEDALQAVFHFLSTSTDRETVEA